jgi:hypothetical protein
VGTVVLYVARELNDIGKSLGALGAAAVAAAHLNFKEAASIWKDSNAENLANAEATAKAVEELWAKTATTPSKEPEVEKPKGPNFEEAQKQNAAKVKLEEYTAALKTEAATFNMGKEALVNYSIQFGPLAKDLKEAGDLSTKLAAGIRAAAHELQTKTDIKMAKDAIQGMVETIAKYDQSALAAEQYKNQTGELGMALNRLADGGKAARAEMDALTRAEIGIKDADAFKQIDRDALTLTGHLQEAAAAAFDVSHKSLIDDVRDTGNLQQQAKLDLLKAQSIAVAAFNEEVVVVPVAARATTSHSIAPHRYEAAPRCASPRSDRSTYPSTCNRVCFRYYARTP